MSLQHANLWIGLMSGTSLDGIDAVLLNITENNQFEVMASAYSGFDNVLLQRLKQLIGTRQVDVVELASLDVIVAEQSAALVNKLIDEAVLSHNNQSSDIISRNALLTRIKAIGSHGITVYHAPNLGGCGVNSGLNNDIKSGDAESQTNLRAFTLQIGDPNTLAHLTQLPVVADFRRADIAASGQGAPLVPPFHQVLFQDYLNTDSACAVLNLGGIANISFMYNRNGETYVKGFDTGPANIVMDAWINKHKGQPYDKNGQWALSGQVNQCLLAKLKSHDFFARKPPKSTGKEDFNTVWLEQAIQGMALDISACDVQATLLQLTAETVVDALDNCCNHTAADGTFVLKAIFICGGGIHNHALIQKLNDLKPDWRWQSTEDAVGIHPDWIEASAFAWLAYKRIREEPSNAPRVTGASGLKVQGGLFLP